MKAEHERCLGEALKSFDNSLKPLNLEFYTEHRENLITEIKVGPLLAFSVLYLAIYFESFQFRSFFHVFLRMLLSHLTCEQEFGLPVNG